MTTFQILIQCMYAAGTSRSMTYEMRNTMRMNGTLEKVTKKDSGVNLDALERTFKLRDMP